MSKELKTEPVTAQELRLHQKVRALESTIAALHVASSNRTADLAQIRLRHLEAAVERHARAEDEIRKLRALVTRLTNVADDLASELSDPGSEALAAIHCGRHFIYG